MNRHNECFTNDGQRPALTPRHPARPPWPAPACPPLSQAVVSSELSQPVPASAAATRQRCPCAAAIAETLGLPRAREPGAARPQSNGHTASAMPRLSWAPKTSHSSVSRHKTSIVAVHGVGPGRRWRRRCMKPHQGPGKIYVHLGFLVSPVRSVVDTCKLEKKGHR